MPRRKGCVVYEQVVRRFGAQGRKGAGSAEVFFWQTSSASLHPNKILITNCSYTQGFVVN